MALGEVVAGMARPDLLVAEGRQGQGVGGRLVELFCARAAERLGAARCFLRYLTAARHRRFYERLGFAPVARLPRYYHDHDFVEYLRDPLVQEGREERVGRGLQGEQVSVAPALAHQLVVAAVQPRVSSRT